MDIGNHVVLADCQIQEDGPESVEVGKVKRLRKQWLVHEDGALAHHLQQEEIEQHYGLNRQNRRTIRSDMSEAKIAQDEEDLQEQEEAVRLWEHKQKQAELDERIARAMYEDNERQQNEERLTKQLVTNNDKEFALELQKRENYMYENHSKQKLEQTTPNTHGVGRTYGRIARSHSVPAYSVDYEMNQGALAAGSSTSDKQRSKSNKYRQKKDSCQQQ